MATEDRAVDRDVFTLKTESRERKAVRKITAPPPPLNRSASSCVLAPGAFIHVGIHIYVSGTWWDDAGHQRFAPEVFASCHNGL